MSWGMILFFGAVLNKNKIRGILMRSTLQVQNGLRKSVPTLIKNPRSELPPAWGLVPMLTCDERNAGPSTDVRWIYG